MHCIFRVSVVALLLMLRLGSASLQAQSPASQETAPNSDDKSSRIRLPEGYVVERVAGPPLVSHPMMAGFDDRGRLYVAESAGKNLRRDVLEQELPNCVRRLEDTDGDGRFDRATTFADNLTFPMGALFYRGSLYVAAPPYIWKFTDTDDDGVADQREQLAGRFGYTGNAADIHGCFLGPDGRIYWCDGRHGHEFRDADGNVTSQGKGSNIFTCRPDGSDLYAHCGGGMDNPVEIDFTESGDVLGTVNILYSSPRIDCLVHWQHGGAYPHYETVLGEYKKTGELLGPIYQFGHVAVSGTCRYRSGALDESFRNDMFVSIFNTGKILRCDVAPQGSTYTAAAEEFLSCAEPDFHPTDILEDADGSLLLVDTGGWFLIGCPTSQTEKPQIKGGIYRIRKAGMPTVDDPRGTSIAWKTLNSEALMALLSDGRFAVRERAIDECALRGPALIPMLAELVKGGDSVSKQNAVWALTRMQTPEASAAVAPAFGDRDPMLRAIACRSALATRDPQALPSLIRAIGDDSPHVRRQALQAIGRLGNPEAVPAVLQRAPQVVDRAEEHALIYALIEINAPERTRPGLTHPPAATRRGALIALDQMDNRTLTEADLRQALHGPPLVASAALRILSRRPELSGLVAETVNDWIHGRIPMSEQTATDIRRLIGNGSGLPELVSTALADREVSVAVRHQVLRALAESPKPQLHASWIPPLRSLLNSSDAGLRQQALRSLRTLGGSSFASELTAIAGNSNESMETRLAAIDALVPAGGSVSPETFDYCLACVTGEVPPSATETAVAVLGRAALTNDQLAKITPLLREAGPIDLRGLLRAYAVCRDESLLAEFVDALSQAKSLSSLTSADLNGISKNWPESATRHLATVFQELSRRETARTERLAALEPVAKSGSAHKGREVFFSEKSKCATCHRVGDQGGRIGPDLSAIGRIRRERDLLEAILFPSVSFAREYEPYVVATTDGKVLTGLIVRETQETLYVQQQTGDPVPVLRTQVEAISPSPVSIMPQGLDTGLSDEQLGDLVAYLRSLQVPNVNAVTQVQGVNPSGGP